MKPTNLPVLKKEFAQYLEEQGMTDISQTQVEILTHLKKISSHIAIRSESMHATIKAIIAGTLSELHPKQGFQVLLVTGSDERTNSIKKAISKLVKGKNLSIVTLENETLSKDIHKAKEHAFHILIASFDTVDNLLHRKHLKAGTVKLIVFTDMQDYVQEHEHIHRVIDIMQLLPAVAHRVAHTKDVTDTIKECFDHVLESYVAVVDDANGTNDFLQERFLCSKENKDSFLSEFCKHTPEKRILIYTRTKEEKEYVYDMLKKNNFSVGMLGNLDDYSYVQQLKDFQKALISFFIVCDSDDVSALQKINVDTIVHYTIPLFREHFVRRLLSVQIKKKTPRILSFVDEEDEDMFIDIVFYYLYSVSDLDDL